MRRSAGADLVRVGLGVLMCLLVGVARAAEPTIFCADQELIVRLPQLDRWRQQHPRLDATLRITGPAGERTFAVNLAERVVPDALVVDLTGYGPCTTAAFEVKTGTGQALATERVSPVPTVTIASSLAMQSGSSAAIEPGSQRAANETPRVALPDVTRLRSLVVTDPTRTVPLNKITYPVVTDADLPGLGSTNGVVVSRQSFAPDDANACSLYFSFRKPIYDTASLQLKEWRKMLIEVPLDRAWLSDSDDAVITLPLERFAIHTTDERELFGKRWNAPEGYNMLGGSSTGLFQGGQTVDVDDSGRIYITNVPDGAGVIRWNPHTRKFEQPPLNLYAELNAWLPQDGDWRRSWDADLAQVVCTRGRVFLVYDRNYRVSTPNGKFETCSGVVSLPEDHWDDAAAFRRELRLHAACWPSADFPLYPDELPVGGSRRLGSPTATEHGIAFGTFRLDLDDAVNTVRLATIKNITDTVDVAGRPLPPTRYATYRGLRKQRLINVGAAGRAFVKTSYGEFTISRAALALTLPDAPDELLADAHGQYRSTFPNAPSGNLTIRFDITSKIKHESAQLGTLAAAMSGVSQGPTYAVIPVPHEPERAIAVCEYNYFFSQLDFSRRAVDGKVYKSYLTQASQGEPTGFPLAVGLGPYHAEWVDQGGALWLYMSGYTGLSRMKYAEQGRTLTAFGVDVFHRRMQPRPIDGVGRESVKDYLYVLPSLEGRLLNFGRGRVGRGGGARSAGLELFDPRDLSQSETAVEMNRCYGLYSPVSRLVFSAAQQPLRQQLFLASGAIRPEYVADIDDPARRPKNQDPKIFAYEVTAGAGLRDRFGWALPGKPGEAVRPCHLAFSPCRQFLVALQDDGTLWTYQVSQQRFVDGVQLRTPAGQALQPLSYSRPTTTLWSAPNGQIFFHAAPAGDTSKQVNYYEVRVGTNGQIEVAPQLAIAWNQSGRVRDFQDIVRCFLPDLKRHDGSYDLVLGNDTEGPPNVRVIDDFIPPRP